MRQSPARFSGSDASCRMPLSVGCITNTFESKFSAHTGGSGRRATSFATVIASMAMPFSVGCERCLFGIGRLQCGRHGRTDVLNGSLDPSGGIALTMSSCLASGTFVICSIQKYYNEVRTHLSLEKDAPIPRAV